MIGSGRAGCAAPPAGDQPPARARDHRRGCRVRHAQREDNHSRGGESDRGVAEEIARGRAEALRYVRRPRGSVAQPFRAACPHRARVPSSPPIRSAALRGCLSPSCPRPSSPPIRSAALQGCLSIAIPTTRRRLPGALPVSLPASWFPIRGRDTPHSGAPARTGPDSEGCNE